MIRVLLVESTPEIVLTPECIWVARPFEGGVELPAPPDSETRVVVREGKVRVENAEGAFEGTAARIETTEAGGATSIRTAAACAECAPAISGRKYEGQLEIFPTADGMLKLVVVLPMEEYLRGVVPSEIGADSPLEAMCAQAVAARSEAFVALVARKYAGDHFDICSDVGCQVFTGAAKRSARSDESVRKTRGAVLLFEGRPISAYYAACCGGHSEDIRNVWSGRSEEKAYWDAAGFDGAAADSLDLTRETDFRAWLNLSVSVYCNPKEYTLPAWTHKNFRWSRSMDAKSLSETIAKKKDIGRVVAIRALRRGVSGRMIEAEFVGENGSLVVGPELAIRRLFTPRLPSAAFAVDPEGSPGRPEKFILRGAGSGHGVGMCQTGALGMANDGKTFAEILRHYYPKATLMKSY